MKGRSITDNEILLLTPLKLPEQLAAILRTDVIGRKFYLSESDDRSGVGVDMKWMEPSVQVEEAFDFYPGRIALGRDYIPIGVCLKGSGDPYFTKVVGDILQIYRIPHDAIIDDKLEESRIEYVCSLQLLLERNLS